MYPVTPIDTQMLKGILPMVILAQLSSAESYGYELVTALASSGIQVSTGTVYPLLTRLETEGKVTSRLVASDQGPARKYYRTTPTGDAFLAAHREGWAALTAAVGAIMKGSQP